MAVIDDRILWDGSLNILSHFDTTERMHRWVSTAKVEEAMTKHRLDTCDVCCANEYFSVFSRDPISHEHKVALMGRRIMLLRKAMGLSQYDLALSGSLAQPTISEIESGKPNTRLVTTVAICALLDSELMIVPRYFVPTFADMLSRDSARQPHNH